MKDNPLFSTEPGTDDLLITNLIMGFLQEPVNIEKTLMLSAVTKEMSLPKFAQFYRFSPQNYDSFMTVCC